MAMLNNQRVLYYNTTKIDVTGGHLEIWVNLICEIL